jgi:hypothetical protein
MAGFALTLEALEIENIHDVVLVELHSLSLKSRSPAISFMGRPSANI